MSESETATIPMTKLAIETDRLTRIFPNNICALDNLSLEVPQGEIFGFLGSNGSGKTTTIHLLLGLLEPTSGSAKVLGFDAQTQAAEIRNRTGVLLEHTGLYERLTAEDNLEFYGRIYRLASKERRARIHQLLNYLGLWERRREKVGKWSRGMKQKLAVARALLHQPALVFLDEPTAGLDPVAAAALGDLLLELVAREGITVFLTTHHLAEAEKWCDRIGILKQGKLLAVGTPNEVRSRYSSGQVIISGSGFDRQVQQQLLALNSVKGVQVEKERLLVNLSPTAKVAPLVTLLVKAGCQIEAVEREKASLEAVFMSLMQEK